MSIRKETQKEFLENVGKVVTGEMRVVEFRRQVLTFTMKKFAVGHICATAHYHYALGMYLHDHPEHKDFLVPIEKLLDVTRN